MHIVKGNLIVDYFSNAHWVIDDVFTEVTDETTTEDQLKIVHTVCCQAEGSKRNTDQIIFECVRNWTSRSSDALGVVAVAHVLDPVFIQENTFAAVRRLRVCLNAIGVCPSEEQGTKFVERNARKNQVVSHLFLFWKTYVPVN